MGSFVDYSNGLSSLSHAYAEQVGQDEMDVEAVLFAYAADLALYVNSAAMLDVVVGQSDYEAVLAEPAPELGLAPSAWLDLKTAFNLEPWQNPLAIAHANHVTFEEEYRAAGVTDRDPW